MTARLLAVLLVVAMPAWAQPTQVTSKAAPSPGDVPHVTITVPKDTVLIDSATAKAKDMQCDSDAAQLAVYKAHPPLPAWAVVLLVVGGAALGAGVTIGVYEATKRPAAP